MTAMKTVKFKFALGDEVVQGERGIQGKITNLQITEAGRSAKVNWRENGQAVARWFSEDELAAAKAAKKVED